MAIIYYEKDADLGLLKGKTVGIVGFGSQGHAHAQNLRDSGVSVVVAELPGSEPWKKAEAAGIKPLPTAEAAKKADIIVMLVPDTLQPKVYRESIEKNLTPGKMLMFAHGFNI
ncbi:MAG: ketol-acid reductoisomerase, partial [Chloroflexi bacterium]|nr:ketol-acid reductoisomerase [Chloroflexota bacterium]